MTIAIGQSLPDKLFISNVMVKLLKPVLLNGQKINRLFSLLFRVPLPQLVRKSICPDISRMLTN